MIFDRERKSIFVLIALLVAMLVITSCDKAERSTTKLMVAVLPDQKQETLVSKYAPMLKYIEDETNLKIELLIPESYEQLLDWFVNNKVDMALFGGVTYVKAYKQNSAIPLVIRDIDLSYRSIMLAHADSGIESLSDTEGKTIAFGSRLSTSGNIMPRYYFSSVEIIPEQFYSEIHYTGAHDLTALWVRDRKVDVGVTHSAIANSMFSKKELTRSKVKVIWESPVFADYIWAVQKGMNKDVRTSLRDSFMGMVYNRQGREILDRIGGSYYVPAIHGEFKNLELALEKLEFESIGSD